MAAREYSQYQKKIIAGYYKNLDSIALSKLQELVSELYLADSEKKRDRLWLKVKQNIDRLNVPPDIAAHIISSRDVQTLAKNLQDWLAGR
jgi:hypothetical protein